MEDIEELQKALAKKHHNKVVKLIAKFVKEEDLSILFVLKKALLEEKENGLILNAASKGYFRLKRQFENDCAPLFELSDINEHTVQESLLQVLGYDKMVPTVEEQQKIIDRYFYFGEGIDLRYFADPRYGLAAACAGWDKEITRPFLERCLTINDAPLKYVAENSLNGKYVRLG